MLYTVLQGGGIGRRYRAGKICQRRYPSINTKRWVRWGLSCEVQILTLASRGRSALPNALFINRGGAEDAYSVGVQLMVFCTRPKPNGI